jgi:hypothetical protein
MDATASNVSLEIKTVFTIFSNRLFLEHDPLFPTVCGHCPPGLKCDILTGACIKGKIECLKSFTIIALKLTFLKQKLRIIQNT